MEAGQRKPAMNDDFPGLPHLPPPGSHPTVAEPPQAVVTQSRSNQSLVAGTTRNLSLSSMNDDFPGLPHLPPPGSHPTVTEPPQAVVTQPRSNQPLVAGTTRNRLPWLQSLSRLDKLRVKQKREAFEALCGHETSNKFAIYDASGCKIGSAEEFSDYCERQCCGWLRTLDLQVMDNRGSIVMCLKRVDYRTMEVHAPPDNLIGVVEMVSYMSSTFKVREPNNFPVLNIKGPAYTDNLDGNVEFEVFSGEGSNQVAKITKIWGGLATEMFTDKDNFEITFPADMDVKLKANLLGALFLIDMVFYENNN